MGIPCECGHDYDRHDKGTGECYLSGCKCRSFMDQTIKPLRDYDEPWHFNFEQDTPQQSTPQYSPEALKMAMRGFQMLSANLENWTYVSTNAEYLDKKQVSDALEQMLGQLKPFLKYLQDAVEIEAMTSLDPEDLL